MTAISKYYNRRIDVAAFSGGTVTLREVQLSQELFSQGSPGQVCAGIQKLAQRFIMELFTIRGSMTFLPDRGCDFLIDASRGFYTELDAIIAFNLAIVDVARNLQREEDDTWPDDERFASAELISLILSGDRVTLRVKLQSRAGDAREFLAPIPIVPIPVGF